MVYKVAFVTCVQLGLSCIEEIIRIGGKLDLLITLNDNKAINKSGRIFLDEVAQNNSIPLMKINNINDSEVIDKLKTLEIDWLFIIGWSQIAKEELLKTPRFGCVGMHPTLLPVGRGRASIPWAILKDLNKTGVTMFKLDQGVDTGDIISQGEIELSKTITATELYNKVNQMHVDLIGSNWNKLITNKIKLRKQNDLNATYWPERRPQDGEISPFMTMYEAEKLVRAVTHPYPGAFYKENDRVIRIWSASISTVHGEIKLIDGYLKLLKFDVEINNEITD